MVQVIGLIIVLCVYDDGATALSGESMRDIAQVQREFDAADKAWPGKFRNANGSMVQPYIDGTFVTVKKVPASECKAPAEG